ncbi:MAG TPA: phosphoribosyl-AMP cyclohydrolase [Thermomicrobiales bacterium]|nr:phosphoribosyl-AMP cyclohydrolase [Thermomicrobiales bacterium]
MTESTPIEWPEDGLIPAVIQDTASGDVLMVGFMNETALSRTRESGFVHFWSRSRQKLWKKGETSGHVQRVRDIFVNCERNSLLIEVEQTGAVCHDGYSTCYYRRLEADNSLQTVRSRIFDPADVYGNSEGAETLTTRWWNAYGFLRDNDLGNVSGTSRALRGTDSVIPRIQDELNELAGVLDGTHVHHTRHDDAILEAGQVCYWVAVESIRTGLTYDHVRPDRALSQVVPGADRLTMATLLQTMARRLAEEPLSASLTHEIVSLVASACGALGLDPLEPIRQDLAALERRDYLAPYFAR